MSEFVLHIFAIKENHSNECECILSRTFAKANWKFVYSSISYHMIAFIYVTSKPPSGHKMRNKSTKSPDRNRLNVIKCKTTETFQTFYRNTNMVFYTNNVA